MEKIYDVAILGGGPAGYTAALYCARAGFSTLVLEQATIGGQMSTTGLVENYPGFPEGVDGFQLGQDMKATAHKFGAETKMAQVTSLRLATTPKVLETTQGSIAAQSVILATGASPRTLGVVEEESLRGRGVSYCATCDGMLYKNKTVAVIGGGNSAVSEALYLSRFCQKVYLVHRRDVLTASRVYLDSLAHSGIEVIWNSRVKQLLSDGKILSGIDVEDVHSGARRAIPCQGLFVAIGREPESALFRGQIDLDQKGYVYADETTKTNLPGVFAIGDVRKKPLRQIVTAVADGAVAAQGVEEYMLELLRQQIRKQMGQG